MTMNYECRKPNFKEICIHFRQKKTMTLRSMLEKIMQRRLLCLVTSCNIVLALLREEGFGGEIEFFWLIFGIEVWYIVVLMTPLKTLLRNLMHTYWLWRWFRRCWSCRFWCCHRMFLCCWTWSRHNLTLWADWRSWRGFRFFCSY